MEPGMRDMVRQRALDRCEYCGLYQNQSPLAALHVEHIIPKKHHGMDGLENLALACIDCNFKKGTNVAGLDPQTGSLTELFHPRRHLWTDHFDWDGILIAGKTAIGRTTIDVLDLNSEDRLELRIVASQ